MSGTGVSGPAREQARDTVVRGLWLEARWDALLEQVDRWIQAYTFELTRPN